MNVFCFIHVEVCFIHTEVWFYSRMLLFYSHRVLFYSAAVQTILVTVIIASAGSWLPGYRGSSKIERKIIYIFDFFRVLGNDIAENTRIWVRIYLFLVSPPLPSPRW